MKNFLIAVIAACTLQGCAYISYVKEPFQDIPAFDTVTPGFYRGGRPKEKGYDELKRLGVKTIVDLTGPSKQRDKHDSLAAAHGMSVVHAPMSIYTRPTDENVLLFLKTVVDKKNYPVFLHCNQGHDRTGAMVAVYRVIVEGKGPKEGYREAEEHGFWAYRGEVVLKDYIHQLKDRKPFYDFIRQWRSEHGGEPR